MHSVDLHAAAVGVTRSGERVLWAGAPRKGLFLRRTDLFFGPVTLFWAGFAVIWTVSATAAGAPLFFTVWGSVFVVVGAYLVVGRFFADAWRRKGTIYVLTDQRLVMRSRRTELSTPLSQLGSVEFISQPGGRGSIRYGEAASPRPLLLFFEPPVGWPGVSQYRRPMLDSIADARHVHDQLLAAVSVTAGQHAHRRALPSRRSGTPRRAGILGTRRPKSGP